MALMLDPQPGDAIYDPTCGTGGMLLSCIADIRRRGKEWRTLKLYGQELNLMTSSIARMNMFLHGIEDFKIVRGDTLSAPAFTDGDRLRQFDVSLANPPTRSSMGSHRLVIRPVWAQLPGHPTAGSCRLRLLRAYPCQPEAEDRPVRDSLPTRRPVP